MVKKYTVSQKGWIEGFIPYNKFHHPDEHPRETFRKKPAIIKAMTRIERVLAMKDSTITLNERRALEKRLNILRNNPEIIFSGL